jgi:DNA-binding MarR family transcriptional regulator
VKRELREIGLAVKRLQARHHRISDAKLAPLGVTLVQWDALRHLHENPGASLHDLAGLTFQTDQAFGALASRMIERGMIERVPGPGRAVRHQLTDHGNVLREAAGGILDGVLSSSFAPLSASELETLGDLLARVLEADSATAGSAKSD